MGDLLRREEPASVHGHGSSDHHVSRATDNWCHHEYVDRTQILKPLFTSYANAVRVLMCKHCFVMEAEFPKKEVKQSL
ncbi:hypothetical protein A3G69_04875 [Candidatus Peribacteria bacterium RIFCSPLOWO2_12_FULL_53_10]|nr:MAG: hypothetical protein A3G69_04875 [Candidatus Peribacteria bacterium RIFCSPLOWO2_12_FULL_53_10]